MQTANKNENISSGNEPGNDWAAQPMRIADGPLIGTVQLQRTVTSKHLVFREMDIIDPNIEYQEEGVTFSHAESNQSSVSIVECSGSTTNDAIPQ